MTATATDLAQLLTFLDRFEREEFAAALQHYRATGKDLTVVNELYSFISKSSILLQFDWPEWKRALNADPFSEDALRDADVEAIRRLLTYAVRQDRFSGGAFATWCSDGSIERALRRVRAIVSDGK